MRELNFLENKIVSAGNNEKQSSDNYDIFWNHFIAASGTGAGYLCSIPVAGLMMTYAVCYYAIYLPAYCLASGVYYAGSTVANGVYNVGSSAINAIRG